MELADTTKDESETRPERERKGRLLARKQNARKRDIHKGNSNAGHVGRISSQSAPLTPKSRWSKRAGLHVMHYGCPRQHTVVPK